MKRVILLGVMFLLLMQLAFAGQAYDLKPFDEQPSQALVLEPKEAVRFELLDGVHTVIVDSVSQKSVNLKFFAFLDKYGYTGVQRDTIVKLDLNKDGTTDMHIYLLRVEGTKATLIFESIKHVNSQVKEPDEGDGITSAATQEPTEQGVVKSSPNKTLTVIAVAVLGLLLFLAFRKKEPEGDELKGFEEPQEEPKEKVEPVASVESVESIEESQETKETKEEEQ